MKANVAGWITIAVCVAVLALLIPAATVPGPLWFFTCLGVVASAWYCWHHPKAPTKASGWFRWIMGSWAIGVFLVAVDAAFFGLRSGNVVFDLSLAILGSIVALSGLVRGAMVIQRDAPNPCVKGTSRERTAPHF
jgi:hypothetical protein